MGMNAYLENTPKQQRTLVDIENIFDGHCKNPIHLIMPQLATLVATIYKTDIPHVVLLYQLNVAIYFLSFPMQYAGALVFGPFYVA